MSYNPFIRGEFPVGVRTVEITDVTRDGRTFPLEVWYPAAEMHRGEDLDAATQDRYKIAHDIPERRQRAVRDAKAGSGKFPLVMYLHGAWGSRLDSTELCTHLSSHGYVVGALDTIGDTIADLRRFADPAITTSKFKPDAASGVAARPRDAMFAIDRLLGGALTDISPLIDPEQIGTTGCSFGGWTSIALNSYDRRIKATVPIAPGWGDGPLQTNFLSAMTRLDNWGRDVPVFLIAQERDALIMLGELRKLYSALRGPKRFSVVVNGGHAYSVDQADKMHDLFLEMFRNGRMPDSAEADYDSIAKAWGPSSERCPARHAAAAVKALCLAHMDENLKSNADAKAFLDTDFAGTFAARGIEVEVA